MIWDYGLIDPRVVPVRHESWCLEREMYFPFLDALGLDRAFNSNFVTWRAPSWHETHTGKWSFREGQATLPGSANSDVSTWHQDGSPYSVVNHFAVWSTKSPTQFQLPDGTVVIPPIKHLMVVDNKQVWHRSGRDIKNRHFVRVTLPNDWTPQEEMKWH